MPAVKISTLIQHVTNSGEVGPLIQRIGGWSETWYRPGTNLAEARTITEQGVGTLPSVLTARAALLPQGASIVGVRYQIVDPRGPAQSTSASRAGNGSFAADVPQAGLLVSIAGVGVGNVRKQIIRGIPDQFILLGEFKPSNAYSDLLARYFGALTPFSFRGRDLTQTAFPIISISSLGLVTTAAAHGYAINDRVRILKTLTAAGRLVGGLFWITAVPSPTSFQLNMWTHGSSINGTVRREIIIYPATPGASGITISRVVTRRVGRPFVQYRGRRARRSS